MKIKPIKTKKDYKLALKSIQSLWNNTEAKHCETCGSNFLEVLINLVKVYEDKHYHIGHPDPIEAIKFRMEQRGLRQIDIAHIIGGKNRVSEVLSRKKPLTLKMIKNLHNELNIPYESLIK
jgi:HTH-type transcriptional regulator/antitoxin HigA